MRPATAPARNPDTPLTARLDQRGPDALRHDPVLVHIAIQPNHPTALVPPLGLERHLGPMHMPRRGPLAGRQETDLGVWAETQLEGAQAGHAGGHGARHGDEERRGRGRVERRAEPALRPAARGAVPRELGRVVGRVRVGRVERGGRFSGSESPQERSSDVRCARSAAAENTMAAKDARIAASRSSMYCRLGDASCRFMSRAFGTARHSTASTAGSKVRRHS
ncbi:hypothetical protein B0T24DRAFT_204727 [Lasiosphaeria ovina]|uniref:Uncharacterized protein n=1 Tax=Lasiosphaeria ovina TaxID=92902 RepID=A0AAE0KFB5_9PEZI|nr:hypothetical protein B0T24DRAFT_204727 [Lasiosphaeria ovina]